MSIYLLKAKFQNQLRPIVGRLYACGVTANQVTIVAGLVSVGLGLALYAFDLPRTVFYIVPIWFLLRMALNAIDGMLAREFGQQSKLGAYLNELADVLSDAALYLPFSVVAPFSPFMVGLVIVLAMACEFVGVLGVGLGATRRYDGPMGKSDRALVFSILGAAVAFFETLPNWLGWFMPLIAALTAWTIYKRIKNGLGELCATK